MIATGTGHPLETEQPPAGPPNPLEVRRRWLASPRGRLHGVWCGVIGSLLLCGTAIAMLGLALVTGFRRRRLYAETLGRWLALATLRVAGVELLVHRSRPFPERQTIYISNHTSTLDVFILLALGLPNSRYFLSGYLRKILPLGLIGYLIGIFYTPPQTKPQERVRCFRRAERVLRRTGESVYLSPEGMRVTTGHLGSFNKGTFHLATRLRAPILPLYIDIPPEVNPGMGYRTMPGTVHVYTLPEIPTDGWKLEELVENKERIRNILLRFETDLRSGRVNGSGTEDSRASDQQGGLR